MAGPRAEKVAVVEEVKSRFESVDAAILTEYRGLKVGDLATLRRALRGAGAEFKIYKNTLVRRATADIEANVINPMLEGPVAIAFVDADVAAVAKVLRDFARTNPALVVKGSLVSGSVLDASSTSRLADLPSREVLLSQLAGAIAAPMQQFAALLKALPQNLAYGISALIDQKRAEGDSGEPALEQAATTDVPSTLPTEGTVTDSDASADAASVSSETEDAAPGEASGDTAGDETDEAETE